MAFQNEAMEYLWSTAMVANGQFIIHVYTCSNATISQTSVIIYDLKNSTVTENNMIYQQQNITPFPFWCYHYPFVLFFI